VKTETSTRLSSLAQGWILSAGRRSITHTENHPKIYLTFDLWLWNSIGFVRLSRNMLMHAKFHRAKCSGLWVILRTEKKNADENNTVRRYRADSINSCRSRLVSVAALTCRPMLCLQQVLRVQSYQQQFCVETPARRRMTSTWRRVELSIVLGQTRPIPTSTNRQTRRYGIVSYRA